MVHFISETNVNNINLFVDSHKELRWLTLLIMNYKVIASIGYCK